MLAPEVAKMMARTSLKWFKLLGVFVTYSVGLGSPEIKPLNLLL